MFLVYKIFQNNYFVLRDSSEYFNLAKNIISDFQFYSGDLSESINPEFYTKRPPLYSLFIILATGFLNSKISILCIQSVLSVSSILITKSIFESYFGKANSLVLFLFIISSLNQFIYSNLLMSEIFLQFLIVITIYVLHKFLTKKSSKYLIFYQILVALLFLAKPVFYLFVFPNIVITYYISRRINYKRGVIYSIIPLLALFLYCQWNFKRTGAYNFSSIQQYNIVNYNLRYFHTNKYGPEYAQSINNLIKQESRKINNYPERLDYLNNTSIDYIKKDFFHYSIFHIKGVFRIFIDPGRFDMSNFFGLNSEKEEVGLLKHLNESGIKGGLNYLKTQPVLIIICFNLVLLFNILKFLGFGYFLATKLRHSKLIFWIILILILYVAFLTGPLGASRFMVPILSLYLFIALYGLSDFIKMTKLFIESKRL
nr:glycosyltransferase family 39 protein [Winogradskyella flava]